MYLDKDYVISRIHFEYQFSVILNVSFFIFEAFVVCLSVQELISGRLRLMTFALLIIVLLFMSALFVFIFRLQFFRTIINIEFADKNIILKCLKAEYVISNSIKVKFLLGIAGREIKIKATLPNGRSIKLYIIQYKKELFKKIDNINYSFLNAL